MCFIIKWLASGLACNLNTNMSRVKKKPNESYNKACLAFIEGALQLSFEGKSGPSFLAKYKAQNEFVDSCWTHSSIGSKAAK